MCLGVPGKVIAVADETRRLVRVDIGGVVREVSLACVLEAEQRCADLVGDWVIVHVGFALSRIDEAEARRTLELLGALEADAPSG
ncbi:hydrogenase expression/formation protein HypC [Methylomarinovum tepidoasis]|uniref:Hydrogenase expression/formation protein HypC n=1 Tax=Methylomarinovum tepidoasis TaxID=2840183 RepID=A0AAU9CJR7_9GAMM|nr:HypC/HybG/HupF family hydrogenase formation chaperone [Methylomarinovum sp. IN45]BCX89661.1 hydrogenase expression/formation protein HypC [Methylomarinovum sp. IN45]